MLRPSIAGLFLLVLSLWTSLFSSPAAGTLLPTLACPEDQSTENALHRDISPYFLPVVSEGNETSGILADNRRVCRDVGASLPHRHVCLLAFLERVARQHNMSAAVVYVAGCDARRKTCRTSSHRRRVNPRRTKLPVVCQRLTRGDKLDKARSHRLVRRHATDDHQPGKLNNRHQLQHSLHNVLPLLALLLVVFAVVATLTNDNNIMRLKARAMKEKLASLRHTVKDQRSVEGEVVGSEEYYAWKGFVTRPTFSAQMDCRGYAGLKSCLAVRRTRNSTSSAGRKQSTGLVRSTSSTSLGSHSVFSVSPRPHGFDARNSLSATSSSPLTYVPSPAPAADRTPIEAKPHHPFLRSKSNLNTNIITPEPSTSSGSKSSRPFLKSQSTTDKNNVNPERSKARRPFLRSKSDLDKNIIANAGSSSHSTWNSPDAELRQSPPSNSRATLSGAGTAKLRHAKFQLQRTFSWGTVKPLLKKKSCESEPRMPPIAMSNAPPVARHVSPMAMHGVSSFQNSTACKLSAKAVKTATSAFYVDGFTLEAACEDVPGCQLSKSTPTSPQPSPRGDHIIRKRGTLQVSGDSAGDTEISQGADGYTVAGEYGDTAATTPAHPTSITLSASPDLHRARNAPGESAEEAASGLQASALSPLSAHQQIDSPETDDEAASSGGKRHILTPGSLSGSRSMSATSNSIPSSISGTSNNVRHHASKASVCTWASLDDTISSAASNRRSTKARLSSSKSVTTVISLISRNSNRSLLVKSPGEITSPTLTSSHSYPGYGFSGDEAMGVQGMSCLPSRGSHGNSVGHTHSLSMLNKVTKAAVSVSKSAGASPLNGNASATFSDDNANDIVISADDEHALTYSLFDRPGDVSFAPSQHVFARKAPVRRRGRSSERSPSLITGRACVFFPEPAETLSSHSPRP